MKKNTWVILGVLSMLAACGGQKEDIQSSENTILAVRTVENTVDLDGGDATEVAVLSGNIESPEQAQAAADNATWMPISKFSQDEELSFEDVNSRQTVRHGDNDDDRRARRRNRRNNDDDGRARRRNRDHDRDWRPYRHGNRWERHTRRWQTPRRQYHGFNRCSYRYINYNGRCVLPHSLYYSNYRWTPRWGYSTRFKRHRHKRYSSSYWYVRFYF